jgi:hypothetical protein
MQTIPIFHSAFLSFILLITKDQASKNWAIKTPPASMAWDIVKDPTIGTF